FYISQLYEFSHRLGQNQLSEECPRRVRFTSTNRHQSRRLPRPVSAPEAAVSRFSKAAPYSITSAARSRNSSDIVRFRAFAVLRLTANSNFSADWSGSSPGFAPFRILSTYPAARWYSAGRSAP